MPTKAELTLELRLDKGLTQAEVAKKLKISQASYSAIERGERNHVQFLRPSELSTGCAPVRTGRMAAKQRLEAPTTPSKRRVIPSPCLSRSKPSK